MAETARFPYIPPMIHASQPDRRFSVAPMMECTDRFYRFMARLLSRRALLYTEMIVTGAVLRGAGDTRWVMLASVIVHWLMLAAQVVVILVLRLSPIASWWVFVAMLLSLAALYLWRLQGGLWRRPERLARVMTE